jgi:hypothetical protein
MRLVGQDLNQKKVNVQGHENHERVDCDLEKYLQNFLLVGSPSFFLLFFVQKKL